MKRHDVIIIGSGLGGLLCGSILSREGFDVCILEKHSQAGGCLQSFKRGDHTFDTGIHYIGSMLPGQTLHSYWKYFGLSDALSLERMDEDCFDMISIGGKDYAFAQGFGPFQERLSNEFPSSSRFLENYVKSLQETVASFPLYNLETRETSNKTTWMSTNAWDHILSLEGAKSADPGLLQVLSGNNFLYAGQKSSTPWHQFALINHSFISSAWRLSKGSTQITGFLGNQILSNGGSLHTKKEVVRIGMVKEKFQAETADGDLFLGSRIISGIHPGSMLSLIDPGMLKKSFRQRLTGIKNTVSSFGLYLALKPGSFPFLGHNIYHHVSPDAWSAVNSEGPGWPGMYFLYTPPEARYNGMASSLCILTYMQFHEVLPWENTRIGRRGQDYLDFKNERAEKLLGLVEMKFPGLKSLVTSMEISSPLTWRDYTGTPEGSLYGIAKDSGDYMRTMILPHSKIPGLYFTGQNLNMHGAPGVTIGAVLTCAEILGPDYLMKKITNAQ